MSKKTEIKDFVGRKIRSLQAGAETSSGKALLADLRRGIGHEPGELPQLFGVLLLDMPESFMSDDGIPTKEEWVCYAVLTLYALHQQGQGTKSSMIHMKERFSIGAAMWRLALTYEGDPNAEQRMLQRLQALATAVDMKGTVYHLRGIVQLLRSKEIPLDYEMLAGDLYEMQFPEGKKQVCLRWGQDFYRSRYKEENKDDEEELK